MTVEELHHHVAIILTEMEDILPRKIWRLSLVARYIGDDHETMDADIIVTADQMPTLLACVQRRLEKEQNT